MNIKTTSFKPTTPIEELTDKIRELYHVPVLFVRCPKQGPGQTSCW